MLGFKLYRKKSAWPQQTEGLSSIIFNQHQNNPLAILEGQTHLQLGGFFFLLFSLLELFSVRPCLQQEGNT